MATTKQLIRQWLGIEEPKDWEPELAALRTEVANIGHDLELLLNKLEEKAKSSVFDRDKIPVSESGRYVPVARRRALAEQASLGSISRRNETLANNTAALEI
jgi:hypothetical protein